MSERIRLCINCALKRMLSHAPLCVPSRWRHRCAGCDELTITHEFTAHRAATATSQESQ